jgi:ABC-type multidrug transport system ATPase subunit
MVALLVEGRLVAFDSPDALRAGAIGGEVLDLTTARPIDAGLLLAVGDITRAERTGQTTWRITVESAARALPSILERLAAQGVEVLEAQPFKPDFDEVFVELVTRARAGRAAGDAAPDRP